jgi:hypothetical protein
MKLRFALLHIGIFSFGGIWAQEEHWDAYMSSWNGMPESILVDMAQMTTAPNKLMPWLVITGPIVADCGGKDGIPNATVLNEMEKVLDATTNMLSGATARRLVGTVTRNCTRLNYYYVRDTMVVRQAINRMYTNTFAGHQYELKIKHDPDWKIYRTFLYPDSAMQSWMACVKQLSAIRDTNTIGSKQTVFYDLIFPNAAARNEFALAAERVGYRKESEAVVQGVAPVYEITVSRTTTVSVDSLLANEALLRNIASPVAGHYRNWHITR